MKRISIIVIKETKIMNKWIILFSLVAACVSCNRKSAEEVTYEHYKDSIKEELMKISLDTVAFNRVATLTKSGWMGCTSTNPDSLHIEIVEFRCGYKEKRFYPDTPYIQYFEYRWDGSLRWKKDMYKDCVIGTSYKLELSGELRIEDEDEPYTYNLDSLKSFVQSLGYDINSKDIYIGRIGVYGVYVYCIYEMKKGILLRKIVLDGTTGEVYQDEEDRWRINDPYFPRYIIDREVVDKIEEVAARREAL